MRSIGAFFLSIIMVNKDLKYVMWDCITSDQVKWIRYRCFQTNCTNFMEHNIIKYISLVFEGIANNLSPIATMVLTYLTIGERF